MEDNEVLTLPQDEHPQLTLEEVYNKYQSQPQTEEEWEEMNKAIKAAVMYENSLPNGTKIRLAKRTRQVVLHSKCIIYTFTLYDVTLKVTLKSYRESYCKRYRYRYHKRYRYRYLI